MVKALIRISDDALVGVDQNVEVSFRSVYEIYGKSKPSYFPNRTCQSVIKTVKKILHKCLLIGSCVAKIITSQPCETNYDNVIHLATAIYNNIEISPVQECGPKFKSLSC